MVYRLFAPRTVHPMDVLPHYTFRPIDYLLIDVSPHGCGAKCDLSPHTRHFTPWANRQWGETSMNGLPHVHGAIHLWADHLWGEMSIYGAKCPWGQLSIGEKSWHLRNSARQWNNYNRTVIENHMWLIKWLQYCMTSTDCGQHFTFETF